MHAAPGAAIEAGAGLVGEAVRALEELMGHACALLTAGTEQVVRLFRSRTGRLS